MKTKRYNAFWVYWRSLGRPGYDGGNMPQACAFQLWLSPIVAAYKEAVGCHTITDYDDYQQFVYQEYLQQKSSA